MAGTGSTGKDATAAATAYGTLALALVTWRLVNLTSKETAGTLQLAALAAQDQWEHKRSDERAKVERVAAAVQQVRDWAIAIRSNIGHASSFDAAVSQLETAIMMSGHADDVKSAELLTRTRAKASWLY